MPKHPPLPSTPRIVTVVAAALVNTHNNILIAQRPTGKNMAGLWEFPGGKIEHNETPEAALIRELREELGITLREGDLFAINFVSHSYENFHLLMLLYGCRRWQGEPRQLEHQAMEWVALHRLAEYPMPPADAPLIAPLGQWLNGYS